MRKGWTAFYCALGGLCLLLLLCCLLEAPAEPADAPRAPLQAAHGWLTAPPPPLEASPDAPRAPRGADAQRALLPQRSEALPTLARMRDANGHILREKRYVDSVYCTFRQEDACG